ncbi:hypothetical protein TL16_g11235 [Triparma laevis f. inornata]|uniref:aspartate--tRNA ligase n=1 Tax=Triparma laevis f. inornata TaxID=1714386 RepID=A0A9W7ES40_9STRA|nr:hypothetical protein TL16_g11235 [Triparma laevis f. inornata]
MGKVRQQATSHIPSTRPPLLHQLLPSTPLHPENKLKSRAEIKTKLTAEINDLGEKIKAAKTAGQPKDEWDPLLKQMLALKVTYKEELGEDFGPKKEVKKKGDANQAANPKNAEKAAKKAAAKAEKEAKKAANRAAREQAEKDKAEKLTGKGGGDQYGNLPLIRSAEITDKVWSEISSLSSSKSTSTVTIRGHLQSVRSFGKGVFAIVRSSLYTVQCVCFESDCIPKAMVEYVSKLSNESIVDVTGVITIPSDPVEKCTQKDVEISVTSFHMVAPSAVLPFQMEDACRPDCDKQSDVGEYTGEEVESSDGLIRVGQETRLNYRWLDLRTPANQSIFRVNSMVGHLFRDCLVNKGFVELHTPKLLSGASEGGSDVFNVDYFGRPACLAMSPQLHKQICCACSGFEKVFETGPVFRAENSNTRRHLCEFTGLDLELCIKEHYYEILDVFSDLFIHIFDGLNEKCKNEIERVREQHPFEDLKYLRPTLRITYAEGCKLLRDAGIEQGDYEDLSTLNEKKLGDLVKEKYGTDFFFMDEYPLSVRPFYTMPNPKNPKLSNSYDFFIRGQEILSGAQRIHDPALLIERANAHGIPFDGIKSYVDSFKHGAQPHGGGGIGLERVVMLFLGLPNIRKASYFPRDPKRLSP